MLNKVMISRISYKNKGGPRTPVEKEMQDKICLMYYEYTMGNNKHRHVHVVVMEKHLGRKLKANEVVHHIDKNKHNNTISNLQVMTASDHARLHAKENYTTRKRLENGRFA